MTLLQKETKGNASKSYSADEEVDVSPEVNHGRVKLCIMDDRNLLFVARFKEIRVYSLDTKNFVTLLSLKTNVLTMRVSTKEQFLHVVTETEHIVYNLPALKEEKRKHLKKTFPKHEQYGVVCYARMEISETSELKASRMFIVQGKNLTHRSKDRPSHSLKDISFYKGQPLFDFAHDHDLAYVKDKITLIVVANEKKYFHKFIKGHSQLTAVAMSPTSEGVVIVSDVKGKISISHTVPNEKSLVIRQMHWHSVPVRGISWSPDGEHFFSGGGEAVLVKWNTNKLIREEIAPRLGGPIDAVMASYKHVVIVLENLGIKTFNHQLYVESNINAYVNFSGISQSGFQWHKQSGAFAYLTSNKRAINFHDPRSKKDVLSLEIDRTNEILGYRKHEKGPNDKDKEVHFCLSDDGVWLVNSQNCDAQVWFFDEFHKTFKLVSEFFNCHDGKPVIDLEIFQSADRDSRIVTCGQDGFIKFWGTNDNGSSWHFLKKLSYKSRIPQTLTLSADGSVLVVAYPDCLTIWSTERFQLKSVFKINTTALGDILEMTFSRDPSCGNLFCRTSKCIFVFSCISIQVVCKINVNAQRMKKIRFSSVAYVSDEDVVEIERDLRLRTLYDNGHYVDVVGDDGDNVYVVDQSGKFFTPSSEKTEKNIHSDISTAGALRKPFSSKFGENFERTIDNPVHHLRPEDRLLDIQLSKPISKNVTSILRRVI